jgi:MurNAc alpha-1-phosphate uridylyltransferase
MRPISLDKPKPLIELGGRTIIDRLLDKLRAAGIHRVVVNVHWLADKMRAHLARRTDLEIIISDETSGLLDSGGGIMKALPSLGEDPFIVLNGDSVWVDTLHPSLNRLIQNFDPDRMECLMLLAATIRSIGYDGPGDFLMEADGRLIRRPESILTPFVYCGAFIANQTLFRDAPAGAFSLNLLWDRAAEEGRLFGLRHDGPWLHAGTPEALEEIEAFLADL